MNYGKYEPAFPAPDLGELHYSDRSVYSGMTLRDYFAAKAMQGLLSDIPKSMYGVDWKENIVQASYGLADLMLKEREK